jgi:hypothetical protein
MHISPSIRARSRRSTACSGLRSPTGSLPGPERARRCVPRRRCRPSRKRRGGRLPKVQDSRCMRASRQRPRSVTRSSAWRATSRGRGHWPTKSDDLGATPQAGVRHRHLDLPPMRRSVARHRQHRGSRSHQADSGISRPHWGARRSSASEPGTAAGRSRGLTASLCSSPPGPPRRNGAGFGLR